MPYMISKTHLSYRTLVVSVVLLSVLMVLFAGCTSQPPSPPATPEPTSAPVRDFSEIDNGKSVQMPLGSEFRIVLEGNPTTGYSWNATLSEGLKLLDSNFTQSEHSQGMVGVGGNFYWDIRAAEMGEQHFSAIYGRPWENITGNETAFEMTFNVE